MKYHELQVAGHKAKRRAGRGIAAGRGKTAGRGTKGQGSRTGSSAKPGFEGGQNPLMQRLPKLPGFKSHRKPAETVSTDQLHSFGTKAVTNDSLAAAGLASSPYANVKLLTGKEPAKKLTVRLQGASATAVAALEAAGGSFEKVARQGRPVTSAKKLAKTDT